jgi:uncharacterized protein DUF6128
VQSNNYNRQVIDLKQEDKGYVSVGNKSYGYCKIETRGNKCRIKLSVNGLIKTNNNIYKACLIKTTQNSSDIIPIGVIELDNNYANLNINTDTNNIMKKDISIDDISIIAIMCKENDNNFRFPLVGYIKELNHPWKRNINNQRLDESSKTKETNADMYNKETGNDKTVEIDDIGNQTFDIIKDHFDEKELTRIYDNIFKEYPKMKPFEGKYSDIEWIRIEPADIIYFPIESWLLTNNTFLLNAYRKYKHLILGRNMDCDRGKPYFILGVPGIYYPKDKVAAYFYGFKDFICCSGAKTKSGEYGYWIKEIDCPM